MVPPTFVRHTVLLTEQVDQPFVLFGLRGQGNAVGLRIEIMYRYHRIPSPVIAERQDMGRTRAEHFTCTPADLRALLAHADDALGPVEEGFRIAPLHSDVHVAERVHSGIDNRKYRLLGGGEAAVWLVGPLHRGAHGTALLQCEVVAHADFIAV